MKLLYKFKIDDTYTLNTDIINKNQQFVLASIPFSTNKLQVYDDLGNFMYDLSVQHDGIIVDPATPENVNYVKIKASSYMNPVYAMVYDTLGFQNVTRVTINNPSTPYILTLNNPPTYPINKMPYSASKFTLFLPSDYKTLSIVPLKDNYSFVKNGYSYQHTYTSRYLIHDVNYNTKVKIYKTGGGNSPFNLNYYQTISYVTYPSGSYIIPERFDVDYALLLHNVDAFSRKGIANINGTDYTGNSVVITNKDRVMFKSGVWLVSEAMIDMPEI